MRGKYSIICEHVSLVFVDKKYMEISCYLFVVIILISLLIVN